MLDKTKEVIGSFVLFGLLYVLAVIMFTLDGAPFHP